MIVLDLNRKRFEFGISRVKKYQLTTDFPATLEVA